MKSTHTACAFGATLTAVLGAADVHAQAVLATFDNFTPSGLVAGWAENANNTGVITTSGPDSFTVNTFGREIILPSGTQIPSPGGFGFGFAVVLVTDASGNDTLVLDITLDDEGAENLSYAAVIVLQDNQGDQAIFNFNDTDGLSGLGNVLVSSPIADAGFFATDPGLSNGIVDYDDLFAFQFQADAGVGYTLSFNELRLQVGGPVTAIPGDANGDGNVDLLDFDILAGNFGAGPGAVGGETIGDFNGDGNVDLLDFDILAGNFGTTSPSAVPEPASMALLGLGGAALLRGRRRRA
ncbi:MAG: dockerin type I domain-containing protein [Planctomycetota bacterium]